MLVQNLVVYGAVPAVVSLLLIGGYFSGVPLLQHIVSPNLDLPNPDAAREFGLLENLQNVYLLAIIAICAVAAKRRSGMARMLFGGASLFVVFVLLEEIDYGLHYYELATEGSSYDPEQVRNIHNIGETTRYIKRAADVLLILLFGLLPLILRSNKNPFIRAVLPSPYCALTLIVMLVMRTLAHGLQDLGVGDPGSIEKNLSEFREVNIYYLALVYCYDIAHRSIGALGKA
jgi:hypothetical protein